MDVAPALPGMVGDSVPTLVLLSPASAHDQTRPADGEAVGADAEASDSGAAAPRHPVIGDRIMVLKEPVLLLVLSGMKTAELRGSAAKPGPVWLASNGVVRGSAHISDCRYLNSEAYFAMREQHRCLEEHLPYKRTFALILDKVAPLDPPIDYYRLPVVAGWALFRVGPADLPRGQGVKRAAARPKRKVRHFCKEEGAARKVPRRRRSQIAAVPVDSGAAAIAAASIEQSDGAEPREPDAQAPEVPTPYVKAEGHV